jgi:large subunit ribosomal protein L25
VPTIQGRDFVVATVASPTVVVEPEKPTEETATEDEDTAGTTPDGPEKPTEEGKDQDAKAKDQSKKVAEGKKEDKTKK